MIQVQDDPSVFEHAIGNETCPIRTKTTKKFLDLFHMGLGTSATSWKRASFEDTVIHGFFIVFVMFKTVKHNCV